MMLELSKSMPWLSDLACFAMFASFFRDRCLQHPFISIHRLFCQVSIEDYEGDAAVIKGADTIPMLLHNEHFKDVSPSPSKSRTVAQ